MSQFRAFALAAAIAMGASACAPRAGEVAGGEHASAEAGGEHPGKAVYDQWCASCHDDGGQSGAPSFEALRTLPRPTVKYALELGYMKIQAKDVPKDELAHYSRGTTDLEYRYPFGWGELEGVASRGDYDMQRHIAASGEPLSFFDEESREHIVPYVVEPAVGVERQRMRRNDGSTLQYRKGFRPFRHQPNSGPALAKSLSAAPKGSARPKAIREKERCRVKPCAASQSPIAFCRTGTSMKTAPWWRRPLRRRRARSLTAKARSTVLFKSTRNCRALLARPRAWLRRGIP